MCAIVNYCDYDEWKRIYARFFTTLNAVPGACAMLARTVIRFVEESRPNICVYTSELQKKNDSFVLQKTFIDLPWFVARSMARFNERKMKMEMKIIKKKKNK